MPEELTLEILDEAIKLIDQYKAERDIIGYYVNPVDMEKIKKGLTSIIGADENKIFMAPPYNGVFLKESAVVPGGHPLIVRRGSNPTLG